MFTDKARTIIDLAQDFAHANDTSELGLPALVLATLHHFEGAVLLSEALGSTPEKLRAALPASTDPSPCRGKLPVAEPVRILLQSARELAQEVPDRLHPGLIDVRHLACALAMSYPVCAMLNALPLIKEDAVARLKTWCIEVRLAPRL